jgi:hypothetical protein
MSAGRCQVRHDFAPPRATACIAALMTEFSRDGDVRNPPAPPPDV